VIRDIVPVGPVDRPVVLGAQYGDSIGPMILVVLGGDATLRATPGFGEVTGFGAATSAFVASLGHR
jgi:hypothetical protein